MGVEMAPTVQLLFEAFYHRGREGLTLFPDDDELVNFLLHIQNLVSTSFYRDLV